MGPFDGAIGWMTGTLLGSVATTACVIAVAFVGMQMLAGRLPVRRGLMVVLGCFLLLGAPLVATALIALAGPGRAPPPPSIAVVPEDPRGELPPADYDPYAGASLRQV